mmetsp:Transcript_15183/g.35293  ORF Transcript_15183/g.35293 Transcript_15183/m.35293 type:complete len:204 (+) Transcript_15183:350-961(+)
MVVVSCRYSRMMTGMEVGGVIPTSEMTIVTSSQGVTSYVRLSRRSEGTSRQSLSELSTLALPSSPSDCCARVLKGSAAPVVRASALGCSWSKVAAGLEGRTVTRSSGSPSSFAQMESSMTRSANLYVSQQMRTGTFAREAHSATSAEPARDTTAPFERQACAPINTLCVCVVWVCVGGVLWLWLLSEGYVCAPINTLGVCVCV